MKVRGKCYRTVDGEARTALRAEVLFSEEEPRTEIRDSRNSHASVWRGGGGGLLERIGLGIRTSEQPRVADTSHPGHPGFGWSGQGHFGVAD